MKGIYIQILIAIAVVLFIYPITLPSQEYGIDLSGTTPQETVKRFMHALDHADWEEWISTMDDDCTMYFPFSARMAMNRTEIETVFKGIFKRLKNAKDSTAPFFNFKPKDMYVQNVSESVALVTWYLEQERGAEGRRSAVLKKTRLGWKIIHFHADRFKLG